MTSKLSADARVAPFPWSALPRLSRTDAAAQSVLARWLARSTLTATRLCALLRLDSNAPVSVRLLPASQHGALSAFDPHAARCEVRVDGISIGVAAASVDVRGIAQRMLGGPDELAAPRPLGAVEQALWALVVATAVEDLGVRGQVWPSVAPPGEGATLPSRAASAAGPVRVALELTLGNIEVAVQLEVPAELAVRVPSASSQASFRPWLERIRLEVPIVLGRCALHRHDLARLAVRSVITLERPVGGTGLEVYIFGGAIGLRAEPGSLAAGVATGYVRRDMALPDEAHVELTVGVGTTQLSLRQITELAVGQIIQLGRPLAGPFELRASGRVLGRGELVDVDGELAVRIVSLGD